MPEFDEKVHMIQFEMLVNKDNKHMVHHLLGYECSNGFEPSKDLAQECGNVILSDELAMHCRTKMFMAWGTGGQYVRLCYN
jgi:hypothetical protein